MKKANPPAGSAQSKVDDAEPISSREAVDFAVAFAKERRAKAQAIEKVTLGLAQRWQHHRTLEGLLQALRREAV